MIDFFDKMRYWNQKRNPFWDRLFFYRGCNFLSQMLANLFLPLYFTVTKKKYFLKKSDKTSGRIIVSMTSFPARISKVHMVVEAILRQTVKPDKIILYLTKSQVPDIEKLPEKLLEMRSRGLEIALCEEPIRSHTKYYEAFKNYPDDIVITVDDDILYRSDLIENLLEWHKKFPRSIIVNWAKKIISDEDGRSFYNHWPETDSEDIGKEMKKLLLFGVGGVLYPPRCMYKDWNNCQMMRDLCLTADDVWLSCMAILAETTFVYTGYEQNHLPVTIRNNETLISVNYERNQICVDNLNNHYFQQGVMPFTTSRIIEDAK